MVALHNSEALAAKGMNSELDEVLHVVVETANLIKGQPLICWFFKIVYEDMAYIEIILGYHDSNI